MNDELIFYTVFASLVGLAFCWIGYSIGITAERGTKTEVAALILFLLGAGLILSVIALSIQLGGYA